MNEKNFPEKISFTLTNSCNCRCWMCGQWSKKGYIKNSTKKSSLFMNIFDWKKVTDEISNHSINSILLRGGEPFLYPHFLELLEYIRSKNIFVSIDTNGTKLKEFAEYIVKFKDIHLTISVDGPEEIHDKVRGFKGCFKLLKEGLDELQKFEDKYNKRISRSINFTITPYSLKGLGSMPDVAKQLHIDKICIMPYYFFTQKMGEKYENELSSVFNLQAYSWKGFWHEKSMIDITEFDIQYKIYLKRLEYITDVQFMPLSIDEFHMWFKDPEIKVLPDICMNVEKLLDIQPDGSMNFCVDFPDYVFGNAKIDTIEYAWNNKKAQLFREYRRKKILPVCLRCGAKYMSVFKS